MLEFLLADLAVLWPATIIASLIVFISWIIIFRYILQKINAKVTSSIPDEVENKTAIYMLCALFWPAALVIGNHFLKKPETARTGRTCIIIFLWFHTFVVILTISILLACIIYLPEIIVFLSNYGVL